MSDEEDFMGDWLGRDPRYRQGRYPWGSGDDDPRPPAETAPPLDYKPNLEDFWEVTMMAELIDHGAVISMDNKKDYHIVGDGIRLWLPFDWIVMVSNEDLVAYIRQGIEVSKKYREQLGY